MCINSDITLLYILPLESKHSYVQVCCEGVSSLLMHHFKESLIKFSERMRLNVLWYLPKHLCTFVALRPIRSGS